MYNVIAPRIVNNNQLGIWPYLLVESPMSQSTSREFFSEVKDWSKRKHQILDMYLASASKILGSRWKTVVYLDGFAGRGTYGEG
ncbi:MAG TPA: hypothetical protein VF276_09330, partial [Chloroflexia bacterium]